MYTYDDLIEMHEVDLVSLVLELQDKLEEKEEYALKDLGIEYMSFEEYENRYPYKIREIKEACRTLGVDYYGINDNKKKELLRDNIWLCTPADYDYEVSTILSDKEIGIYYKIGNFSKLDYKAIEQEEKAKGG